MKEPETEQFVIPGVVPKTWHAYKKLALQYDRPLAWVLRKALDVALEQQKALAEALQPKGGGGNRTRSLTELAAA